MNATDSGSEWKAAAPPNYPSTKNAAMNPMYEPYGEAPPLPPKPLHLRAPVFHAGYPPSPSSSLESALSGLSLGSPVGGVNTVPRRPAVIEHHSATIESLLASLKQPASRSPLPSHSSHQGSFVNHTLPYQGTLRDQSPLATHSSLYRSTAPRTPTQSTYQGSLAVSSAYHASPTYQASSPSVTPGHQPPPPPPSYVDHLKLARQLESPKLSHSPAAVSSSPHIMMPVTHVASPAGPSASQQRPTRPSDDLFGTCASCCGTVTASQEPIEAQGQLYHAACFVCSKCSRPVGQKFYSVKGRLFCEQDYRYSGFHETADKCAACGHIIVDMELKAIGVTFHPRCFRCCVCNCSLDSVEFTVDMDNNVHCLRDYNQKYAPRCAGCSELILTENGECDRVVANDKDYHISCFRCQDCNIQLNDTERNAGYLLQSALLCRTCFVRRRQLTYENWKSPV